MARSPADVVAALEAQADRRETPCGDGSMVWRVWGEGPSVVLLHGGSGSWTHWIRNIPALATHRRVLAADLPGLGDSAMPAEPVNFVSVARAVREGIEALVSEDESLDLVGFSLGSHTAQYVAEDLGARVRRLVLVNGFFVGDFVATPQALLERWRRIEDRAQRQEILRRNLGVLMLWHPDSIDELATHLYEADVQRARLRPGKFLHERDKTLIERLKCPIIAIGGEHDPTAGGSVLAQGAALLEVQPEARFHLVPNAGHWVSYEAADAFNGHLAEALA